MKQFRVKLTYFLLSCLFFVALALGVVTLKPSLSASANTPVAFSESTYKTAGASVRLYEKDGTPLEDGLSGIRFHVLMDAQLYHANKDNENFKSYTAILPQYLLSGELTCSTANVLVLETTEVWRTYAKDPTYVESVAFLYGLPVSQHATEIAFRGFVSLDGGATFAQSTDTGYRSIAYVAKAARDDAEAVLSDTQLESKRIATLNTYIPSYSVTYNVGDSSTTESVEYGDFLSSTPSGISIWRDANGNLVDLDAAVTSNKQALVLTAYAKVSMSLSNASATFNGSSMANGASVEVKCGTYSLTASPITNYKLASVSVNGANKGAGSSHSLTVTGDTSISVSATIITYTVTLDNSGGASVSGTVNGTFNINSTCSFTLGTGFYTVTVNGTTISPNTSRGYSFTVTANSTVKIVKMTDSQTQSVIMNAMANTSGGTLEISGSTLVSTYWSNGPDGCRGTINIGSGLFEELKKYGYTTITFDISKDQKSEWYKKRIQNVTDGVTIAESAIFKKNISATNVSLTKAAQLESQYKSGSSWTQENEKVYWTISNIRYS